MSDLLGMALCATHGWTLVGQYLRTEGLYVGCLRCWWEEQTAAWEFQETI